MKMGSRKLTQQEQDALAAVAAMADEDIDTSDLDALEVRDWSQAKRGILCHGRQEQVMMGVDADVLAWFKARYVQGYQNRINAALRAFAEAEEQRHDHP